jgi:hypothetical protein
MPATKIHHFIVHEIIRDKTKYAQLKDRKEENDVDKMAEEVISSLLGMLIRQDYKPAHLAKMAESQSLNRH